MFVNQDIDNSLSLGKKPGRESWVISSVCWILVMGDDNASGGHYRSRPALGDVTNRIGKSGFSGREKDGVKSSDFN